MPQVTFKDRDNMQFHVPAGEYVLGVEKAEFELAKKSGNEQVKLTCRVLGVKDAAGNPCEGPLVYDYLQFEEKMQWKFDVFLKAIKCVPQKGAVLDVDDAFIQGHFVGALGWATLSVDEYQGRKNNKIVQWITNHKVDAYAKYSSEKPAPAAGAVPETQEPKADEDFK